MNKRLVGVTKNSNLLHVFPVETTEADETIAAEKKAIEAAIFAGLVQPTEVDKVSAREHVSRRGQFMPFGDILSPEAETKEAIEAAICNRAYQHWEQSGRPEGKQDEFWYAAEQQLVRERAYDLWEREGRPENKSNEHWTRSWNFRGC